MGELADEFMGFAYRADPRVHGFLEDYGDAFSAHTEKLLGMILQLERRAEAAERRAVASERVDALLALVSRLVQTDASTVAIARVTTVADRMENGRWRTHLEVEQELPGDFHPGSHVALLSPRSAPNPELLERASVELAAEYVRVKAEQDREQAAAPTGFGSE